jgi:TonB family protein
MSRKRFCVLGVLIATTLWHAVVLAQAKDDGVSERAKRQAENPFKWIIMQDDKPRTRNAAAVQNEKDKKPVAPAVASAGAPAIGNKPVAESVPVPESQPMQLVAPAPADPPPTLVAVAATPQVAAEPIEVDEPLRPIKSVAPELPQSLVKRGISEGSVKVRFTVNPDGSIDSSEVVTTTNRSLNGLVLTALKEWRFAPIKRQQSAAIVFAFKDE